VEAAAGSVAWNEVSKQATWVSRGASAAAVRTTPRLAGLWSGAKSASVASASSVDSSMTTASVKAAPPWTIRWPTASTAPASSKNAASIPVMAPGPVSWDWRRSSSPLGHQAHLQAGRSSVDDHDPHVPTMPQTRPIQGYYEISVAVAGNWAMVRRRRIRRRVASMTTLSERAHEADVPGLEDLDAWFRGRELPGCRADLSARQSAAARTAHPRAHQAPPPRHWGTSPGLNSSTPTSIG